MHQMKAITLSIRICASMCRRRKNEMRLKCPVCGAWINVRVGHDRLTRCPICSARLTVVNTNWLLPLLGFVLFIAMLILSALNMIWSAVFPIVLLSIAVGAVRATAAESSESDSQTRQTSQTRGDSTQPNAPSREISAEILPPTRARDITAREFCPYCGSPVKPGYRFCTNCGASLVSANSTGRIENAQSVREVDSIGACMVCGLAIQRSAQVAYCVHCGNVAHRLHLLEWIHVKGRCPICGEHLTEEDI